MIEVRRLSFAYGGQPRVFEDFSLRVDRGEALSVIGPSGCGKTTLLYLLAGLRRPQAGEVAIDGFPLSRPRPRSGLVLQDHGLLPWATVRENARLGLTIRAFYGSDGRHAPADEHLDDREADRRVDRWLARLGIEALQHRFPGELSRGQRQRAALARSLATEPDLLMLDEPFSALDAPTREELEALLLSLAQQRGLTMITVTHDIETAVRMGRRVMALGRGVNREPRLFDNHTAWGPAAGRGREFIEACGELRRLLGTLVCSAR